MVVLVKGSIVDATGSEAAIAYDLSVERVFDGQRNGILHLLRDLIPGGISDIVRQQSILLLDLSGARIPHFVGIFKEDVRLTGGQASPVSAVDFSVQLPGAPSGIPAVNSKADFLVALHSCIDQ